jgi:hypothetical protein
MVACENGPLSFPKNRSPKDSLMLNRPSLSVITAAAVVVGLSACSGGSVKTAATTPSSRSTSATSAPTSTTQPTAANATLRSVVNLKKALIQLADLPSGFSIEPASASGDKGVSASSKDPSCAALVRLSNAKQAPGSTASAGISLSGGQDGPFVDESIDALGSENTVAALQTSFKSAVATCHQLTITMPGQGSSTMKFAEVSAPKFGDHPFAVRMTASGGSLTGLEMTQVTAGVRDVVVSITFVAALPEDVDGATEAAVTKAEKIFGASTSGV